MTPPRWRIREIASWTARWVTGDATVLPAYVEVAARWEAARERLVRDPSPVNRADYDRLTGAVAQLSKRLGLPTVTTVVDARDVPGVTDVRGFLPGDLDRLIEHGGWTPGLLDDLHADGDPS